MLGRRRDQRRADGRATERGAVGVRAGDGALPGRADRVARRDTDRVPACGAGFAVAPAGRSRAVTSPVRGALPNMTDRSPVGAAPDHAAVIRRPAGPTTAARASGAAR